jgi:hypothetical protein
MNTMFKQIVTSIAIASTLTTATFTPTPVRAMTAEEFLKFMGVLGRYSDDLNRTFRPNNQPNISPQPDPNSQPDRQPLDRYQPNQQDSNPTIDRSQEQFFPLQ